MAYEDWTTYTKVGDAQLDVIAETLTAVFYNGTDRWVSDDKGAGFFVPGFEHQIDTRITNGVMPVGGRIGIWAVTNAIEDMKFWEDNTSQACSLEINRGSAGNKQIATLTNHETGVSDVSGDHTTATYWYISILRAPTDIVVGLFTDAARTVLQDLIAVPVSGARTYRYMMNAISASNSGGAINGVIENLDLNEAASSHLTLLGVGN